MTIIDKLIPEGKYNRPGTSSVPKRICIHYTGDCGASADRLALFFTANPNAKTSSQYIVGMSSEVIRCVPDNEIAYAAAGKNSGTIHIEVCYKDKSGKFEEASITALGELVLYLMNRYGISAGNVVRHYDLTGKHCPVYYVDETRWAALHERITAAKAAKKLYRVQVGAFSSRANAENYAAAIRKAGFGAFVVEV
ncbi:MAG: N-acetylmuramoyl-L-alanine amidase [Oscillospiraceae bacterium]